jgi:hypothetical protein
VRCVDLHGVAPERRATALAAVEHMAARVFLDLHAIGITQDRHLVHDQHRGHEGARQIVPIVNDQNIQFRVHRYELAQFLD